MNKLILLLSLLSFSLANAGIKVVEKRTDSVLIEDIRHYDWEILLIYTLKVDCRNKQVILTSIRYESGHRVIKEDKMAVEISDYQNLEKVCKL
jgi:hypothetical protein